MKILFVHGMGATPFDCFPTFVRLRRLGYKTATFSYFLSFQNLDSIKSRLLNCFAETAAEGEYAVIGHSLGGILVRDILMKLPAAIKKPKYLFLLGSPMIATQVNKRFSRYGVYKLLFGQRGQLVPSDERMQVIGTPPIPTTCVVGTKGFSGRRSPFPLCQTTCRVCFLNKLCPDLGCCGGI
ncbi:esterase/lipase family protein [Massilia sp. TWP1-3-3]|uniref:esterase/lipase family protein n=1 Tax=Massilia sp. TWP1-3-3 TaxID=2804573 RepID=UPI003CECD322